MNFNNKIEFIIRQYKLIIYLQYFSNKSSSQVKLSQKANMYQKSVVSKVGKVSKVSKVSQVVQ